MKQINSELSNHLQKEHYFLCCDIYDLYLANGESIHFCEHDVDIRFNNRLYLHDMCIIKRTNTEISNALTVDKLSLTMHVDAKDSIHGTKIQEVARNGGFDDATLVCSKVFLDDTFNIIGSIELFSGMVEVRKGGGLEIKIEVKSKIQQLNVEWPMRRYYPNCPYSLYSKGCGVNRKQFEFNGKIISVTNSAQFTVDVNKADNFFAGGVIAFLSGANVGKLSTVRSNKNGEITLLVSQETPPASGDMVKLYAGCDKSYEQCKNKFNNGSRNRSTPYVPLKDSIY